MIELALHITTQHTNNYPHNPHNPHNIITTLPLPLLLPLPLQVRQRDLKKKILESRKMSTEHLDPKNVNKKIGYSAMTLLGIGNNNNNNNKSPSKNVINNVHAGAAALHTPGSQNTVSFQSKAEADAAAKARSQQLAVCQAQVISIYQKYNPSKMEDLPKILQHFKGREVQLVQELRKKYNVPASEFNFPHSSLIKEKEEETLLSPTGSRPNTTKEKKGNNNTKKSSTSTSSSSSIIISKPMSARDKSIEVFSDEEVDNEKDNKDNNGSAVFEATKKRLADKKKQEVILLSKLEAAQAALRLDETKAEIREIYRVWEPSRLERMDYVRMISSSDWCIFISHL